MKLKSKIKEFIEDDLLNEKVAIAPETELFTSGLLDSISLVALVAFIDEELKIKIISSDIKIENVNTLESLVKLIESKQ
jgi:acyl carrier protein